MLPDKNEALRTPSQDLPVLAKARLVAWRHTDLGLPFLRTDAPTVSELGTHLVHEAAASWGSPLIHGDIEQASLHGIQVHNRPI